MRSNASYILPVSTYAACALLRTYLEKADSGDDCFVIHHAPPRHPSVPGKVEARFDMVVV